MSLGGTVADAPGRVAPLLASIGVDRVDILVAFAGGDESDAAGVFSQGNGRRRSGFGSGGRGGNGYLARPCGRLWNARGLGLFGGLALFLFRIRKMSDSLATAVDQGSENGILLTARERIEHKSLYGGNSRTPSLPIIVSAALRLCVGQSPALMLCVLKRSGR